MLPFGYFPFSVTRRFPPAGNGVRQVDLSVACPGGQAIFPTFMEGISPSGVASLFSLRMSFQQPRSLLSSPLLSCRDCCPLFSSLPAGLEIQSFILDDFLFSIFGFLFLSVEVPPVRAGPHLHNHRHRQLMHAFHLFLHQLFQLALFLHWQLKKQFVVHL